MAMVTISNPLTLHVEIFFQRDEHARNYEGVRKEAPVDKFKDT